MDLLIIIILLIVCYFTGSTIEKNHYKKIKEREVALFRSPCMSYGKAFAKSPKIKHSYLVTGSVVIGCDYFKTFLAGLRNIFGGNVSSCESVLDRGRREAILRMREYAAGRKADAIINVKIESVTLDALASKNSVPKICVTAYGTAIEYEK